MRAGRRGTWRRAMSRSCGISWQRSIRAADRWTCNLPGFGLHELKGRLKGHRAVSVSGNWRITFRFEDGAAVDVNDVDYH